MTLTGLLSSGWNRDFTPETKSEMLFSYDSGPRSQVTTSPNLIAQRRRGSFSAPFSVIPSGFSPISLHYSPWATSTSVTGTYLVDTGTNSPYWSGIASRGLDLVDLTASGKPINDSTFSYKTSTSLNYDKVNRVNSYAGLSDGSGNATYQVNYGWQSSGDLSSGTGVLIDFSSLPLKVFGESKSLGLTNVKKISITSQKIDPEVSSQTDIPTTNTSGLVVGGGKVTYMGGSNPIFEIFGSGCHLGTNGVIDIQNPSTGWPVSVGSATTISIYNPGSVSSHYEIAVLGTSESGVV